MEHGLAPDERTARGLILAGRVLVDDRPLSSEHASVQPGSAVRVKGEVDAAVSRGAHKLEPALTRLSFDVAGRVCLDLGISTGGFTQVLLQHGARRVYGVDVAYGVTAASIRADARVILLERTNARNLTPEMLEPVERVVGDLSFIGWSSVIRPVAALLAPGAELLLLVKPQFELPPQLRARLSRGVLRDPADQLACLVALYDTWTASGLAARAIVPSELPGAKGNREYFALLQSGGSATSREDYAVMAQQAVDEAAE